MKVAPTPVVRFDRRLGNIPSQLSIVDSFTDYGARSAISQQTFPENARSTRSGLYRKVSRRCFKVSLARQKLSKPSVGDKAS